MAALGWLLNLGFAGGVGTTYTLTADAGAFTLTGNATALKASRKLVAGTGSFTLTGNATGLAFGRVLAASAGAFTLTGNATTLKVSRKLAAATGAFTYTGNAATLTYSGELLWTVVTPLADGWTAQASLHDQFQAGDEAGRALRIYDNLNESAPAVTNWTVV